MNPTKTIQRLIDFIPEINALPGDLVSSSLLRARGIIGDDLSVEVWAIKRGLPIVLRQPYGKGQRVFFRKADLLRLATGQPVGVAVRPDAPRGSLLSSFIAKELEKFQRDFAATIDALYNEMQEGARQQREANRILFKKLVDIEEKVTALVKEWG